MLHFVGNGDHFSMQNSQASSKKKFTKVCWGTGKVTHRGWEGVVGTGKGEGAKYFIFRGRNVHQDWFLMVLHPDASAPVVVNQGRANHDPGRDCKPPPPLPSPPFQAKRHFSEEGGGGVHFEAPRGREFYTPPPPPVFIRPPPLEGYFQGWGGSGCIKFGPVHEVQTVN